MAYSIVRIVAPVREPVSVEEAKRHLRVDDAAEDLTIAAQIVAAREYAEAYTGRQLVTARFRARFDEVPTGGRPGVVALPFPPLVSVEAVRYVPADGSPEATVPPGRLRVDTESEPGRVFLVDGFPAVDTSLPGSFAVEFTAGYGEPDAVPQAIRAAILLHVGHLFLNREAVVTGTIATALPMAIESLLGPYRMVF